MSVDHIEKHIGGKMLKRALSRDACSARGAERWGVTHVFPNPTHTHTHTPHHPALPFACAFPIETTLP
jgi:hypothetical protein